MVIPIIKKNKINVKNNANPICKKKKKSPSKKQVKKKMKTGTLDSFFTK